MTQQFVYDGSPEERATREGLQDRLLKKALEVHEQKRIELELEAEKQARREADSKARWVARLEEARNAEKAKAEQTEQERIDNLLEARIRMERNNYLAKNIAHTEEEFNELILPHLKANMIASLREKEAQAKYEAFKQKYKVSF